jgi:hypothetical protein
MTAADLHALSPVLFRAIVIAEDCAAMLERLPVEAEEEPATDDYERHMRRECAMWRFV